MNLTPNASFDPASRIPYPPEKPAASAKRSKWLYIGLGAGILLVVCCFLVALGLFLSGILKQKPAPAASAVPDLSPTETTLPETIPDLPVSLPTDTNLPENIPGLATQPPVFSTSPYSDNFSNTNSGWPVASTDSYETSYNSSGFYEMAVKKANYHLVANSPDHFPKPVKNIILGVRAQPAQGNTGEYGVFCRYQDIDNLYMAGISGNQFYIAKLVAGKWTYLTNPGMQPLPSNTPDAQGYNVIAMSCIDSFIVLEINGVGAAHVTDDTFSTGNVGLYVLGTDKVGQGGYYARAGFTDFSAKLPEQ
jgi:hypothetical protein